MRLAILLPASAVIALTARPALPQPRQHVTDPTIKAEVIQLIRHCYFRPVPIDTSLSADEIVASLDPHSEYTPREHFVSRVARINATTFEGFGLWTCRLNGKYMVDCIDRRDCARRAGLWAGDELLEVAGTPIASWTEAKLDSLFTDPAEWAFELQVYRKSLDTTLRFWISRNYSTPLPQISYFGMLDDTTGYIRFGVFSDGIARQVRCALDTLAQRGMTSLILDLRGNRGGIVREEAQLEDLFVSGCTQMFSQRSMHEDMEESCYAAVPSPYETLPLTVLVNHDSWSAAELLAGSLQDLDRATIVGEATGGKALVTRYFELSNGDRLSLAVAGLILPSGRCTQAIYHDGVYDFGPPDLPNGVTNHFYDALYTQMPCQRFHTAHGRDMSWHEGIIPDIVIADVSDYPGQWYLNAIDSFAIGILRDSNDVYHTMDLAAFMGQPRVAPAIVETIEKRLEWLDTSANKSVALHFAPQLARTIDWRIALRIWDGDATLRYYSRRSPIVRRAWLEPRPQTLTAPAR